MILHTQSQSFTFYKMILSKCADFAVFRKFQMLHVLSSNGTIISNLHFFFGKTTDMSFHTETRNFQIYYLICTKYVTSESMKKCFFLLPTNVENICDFRIYGIMFLVNRAYAVHCNNQSDTVFLNSHLLIIIINSNMLASNRSSKKLLL